MYGLFASTFTLEYRSVEYVPKLDKGAMTRLIDATESYVPEEPVEMLKFVKSIEDVESILSRYISNLEQFILWRSKPRPKRYSRKTIIVDDVFYYVPYHFDSKKYGVYFRLRELWDDFVKFMSYASYILRDPRLLRSIAEDSDTLTLKLNRVRKNSLVLVNSLFVEYIVFHYAHSVAHHVFEDMALILEGMKKGKYSLLRTLEEENFCHYVAFTTLEKYIPGVLIRSKKAERLISIFYPLIPEFRWEKVESINFATTKLLYAYYGMYKNDYRRPYISSKTRRQFEGLFRVLWKFHYTYEEELTIMKSRPFIQRLFLTTY